jgi:hypothetical protein
VSAQLGIDPAGLLELEGRMFDALERAAGKRWTIADELAAQALELAHVHYVAFLASCGVKGAKLPAALRVPRPDADDGSGFEKPRVLSPADFVAEFGPSSSSGSSSAASPKGAAGGR